MSPRTKHVSLPSINELLPEYMMQNWYAESRERSTVDPPRAEQVRGYEVPPSRVPAYHDPVDQERRWHSNREYQGPQGGPPFAHRDPRAQSGLSQQQPQGYFDSRRPQQVQYLPQSAAGFLPGPDPSSSSSYGLDVLRPHPVTNHLENIASSADIVPPPRLAHAPVLGYSSSAATSAETTSAAPSSVPASGQKARSSFRVQIPPTPPPNHDALPSASVNGHYGGSVRGSPSSSLPLSSSLTSPGLPRGSTTPAMASAPLGRRPGDYDMLPSPMVAQGYTAADPYFSPHIPVSKQQSLYRMQTHAPAAPNVEEKKHCCPHCNKRFNRPSSLNIHVNTHTGAKPFQCPYPGCNRKFNVNSNMRRHWRNHLSTGRTRRDSISQLPEAIGSAMPPTPPLTASNNSSPRSHYTQSLPSSISSAGSSAAYNSRSPSPQYSDEDVVDADNARQMSLDMDTDVTMGPTHTVSTRPIMPMDVSAAAPLGMPMSEARHESQRERDETVRYGWRQRSRSSPVPRYREDMRSPLVHNGIHGQAQGARMRSNSCNVPGCDCRPISTTLRPAFPSSGPDASAGPSRQPR